jgi:hypothetical protein
MKLLAIIFYQAHECASHPLRMDRNRQMQSFTIEWLGDGQITVESDDGTTLQGIAAEILPALTSVALKSRPWALAATASPGFRRVPRGTL